MRARALGTGGEPAQHPQTRAARRGTRSVVLAHAFVAGAQPSDSERDITVGGVSRVPTRVFGGVDYVALGHLHGPHVLSDRVRYSGSPLAYSFSEAEHRKGSWLVDLDATGAVAAEWVEAPVPRALARLRGTVDELLDDPRHAWAESCWVEATLTDAGRPLQAMERLRRRFPHTLLLSFAGVRPPLGAAPAAASLSRRDHEIAVEFLTELRGCPPADDEVALLHRAVDACCDDPEVDTLVGAGGAGGAT